MDLCPTRNRPPRIGWRKKAPTARWSNWVGQFKTSTSGGQVGRILDGEKRWIKHRSGENLTEFYEISPDPIKISSDLREVTSESGKISPESGFYRRHLEIFCRNLGFIVGFWKFWLEFGNLSVGSGFSSFKGGKLEPDPLELVSSDEDPSPTRRSNRVSWF